MAKAPFSHLVDGVRVVLDPVDWPGKWEPKELAGLHGTFLGFSLHGYARVRFDGLEAPCNMTLVHPESLKLED